MALEERLPKEDRWQQKGQRAVERTEDSLRKQRAMERIEGAEGHRRSRAP
jgi:hypothetical protein